MVDVGATIEPRSDQQNADDFLAGPRNITITKVTATDNADQPISIFFVGDDNKPFKPCKSMRRVLVSIWGRDGTTYVGKSLTLYRDEKVKFGGFETGGIRISHASHIEAPVTMALTATRGSRRPYTVKPLVVDMGEEAPIDKETLLTNSRDAASRGKDALQVFWKALNKPERAFVTKIMDELKATALKADEEPTIEGQPHSDDGAPDVSEDFDDGNITDEETAPKDLF